MRVEIRGALTRDIPVVPVLLDGAEIPDEAQLPDDIKGLLNRNAEFVDYRTFDADVQRLIKKLGIGDISKQVVAPVIVEEKQREQVANERIIRRSAGGVESKADPADKIQEKPPGRKPTRRWLTALAVGLVLLGAAVASVYFIVSLGMKAEGVGVLEQIVQSDRSRQAAEAKAADADKARQAAETKAAEAEKARQAAAARADDADKARLAAFARAEDADRARRTAEAKAADSEKARQAAEAKAARVSTQEQTAGATPDANKIDGPLAYSPWTKFCNTPGQNGQDANAPKVCFTARDARTDTGVPVVAAALIEPDGNAKKVFRVTAPNAVQLQYGTRIIIDNDQPSSAQFLTCFNSGCISDYEGTPELIAKLKKGQTLNIQAINLSGKPISFPVPLADFAKVNEGPSMDPKTLEEQRKKY